MEEADAEPESSEHEEVDEHGEADEAHDVEDDTAEDDDLYREVVEDGRGGEGADQQAHVDD